MRSPGRPDAVSGRPSIKMKLYLIIYNLAGLIVGVIGPFADDGHQQHRCDQTVQIVYERNLREIEPLTFKCEWAEIRPQEQVQD
jgi:hypothetical protein